MKLHFRLTGSGPSPGRLPLRVSLVWSRTRWQIQWWFIFVTFAMLRRLVKTEEVLQRVFIGPVTTQRRYARMHINSFIKDFADTLSARQPVFRVPPASIQILRQPAEFYRTLLVRPPNIGCFNSYTYVALGCD
jgi:hypothetical protein